MVKKKKNPKELPFGFWLEKPTGNGRFAALIFEASDGRKVVPIFNSKEKAFRFAARGMRDSELQVCTVKTPQGREVLEQWVSMGITDIVIDPDDAPGRYGSF